MITYTMVKGFESKNFNLNYGKFSVLKELIKKHNMHLSYLKSSGFLDWKIENQNKCERKKVRIYDKDFKK